MIERLDLQRALLDLPRRQRDAVVLRYIADLSEADVASLLGCSAGTVKSHLNRGTTRLRLILNDSPGGL
jgi:RNA polymerase sigma factor (sigma-70 family)